MKSLYNLLVMLTISSTAMAQSDIDRTKAPKPGPVPVINIADPAAFTLPNGLKVFVVTNTKLPQVAASLVIDRDPLVEGDKAGMTGMAGSLMRRGTTKMNKITLDENVDFLGGSLSTSATSAYASSLKNNFPKLMELMADVVLRPAFSSEELEKVRKQTLSGLAQQKDDPNSIAGNVSSALLYGKTHPYGEIETESTVKNITLDDIKKYHATWWKPNIAYLIFVGDITVAEAKKLTESNFGGWAKGEVPKLNYAPVQAPAKTMIAVVDRPSSVQSIISIGSPVQLKPGAPDAIPVSVMSNILGGGFSSRLNQNLREKYGFTYGAGGGVSSDKLVGRFRASASVRNEKTDSAVGQFIHEFNRIRSEQASDSEVTALKNYMSGGFARSLEDPSTIADFALNVARYNLPKDYYRTYLTRLSKVSATEVKQMANQYVPVNNLIITIVGNAKEIAKGLDKYGEVKYFDMYGNPATAPVEKKVAEGVSAESVLQQAITAYGGEAALTALKDITLSGSADIMGQQMQYEQKNVMPDGFSATVKMGEMTLMQQKKAGAEYKVTMQGMDAPLDAGDKVELDAKAALYEERYYLTNKDVKLELQGIEQVEGKDAYKVKITLPGADAFHSFYDVKTGLRLQDVKEQEMGQAGKVSVTFKFLEYKDYNGVKVPVKLLADFGMFQQNINITDVKLNQGLKLTDL
ncbi:MAG TPA: pitrilysin family protein [Phnomibacter sp.]|nr:pitrilysin family protein [Phnomibacter sp.]